MFFKHIFKGKNNMSKYEQLIEFIINDQEDKARALFHQIVVERSREIYESLIDQEDLDEVSDDSVESLVDEVSADEEGMDLDEDEMDLFRCHKCHGDGLIEVCAECGEITSDCDCTD